MFSDGVNECGGDIYGGMRKDNRSRARSAGGCEPAPIGAILARGRCDGPKNGGCQNASFWC